MDFDIRFQDYTFKHTYSPSPEIDTERFKEHYHTTYELLYFVRGDADFMLEHTLYKIKPGTLLIAKPGEYHNIVFKSQQPYERYVIRFDAQSLYPYVRRQLEKAESVYYIEGTPLAVEFRRMDEHVSAVHEDLRLSACIGTLNILIAYLVSSHDLIQKADYISEDSKRIIEYIDAHLSEIHSADDLAAALHMSKSTIYKIFSKQFSNSLMSYIRTQKCMAARNLISEGVPTMEVSNRLGFNHYSSFYRDYHKVFNRSPSSENRDSPLPRSSPPL